MRKIIAGLIICTFVFTMTAMAGDEPKALKKLGRGAANIATSPFEITNSMQEVNNESGFFGAITWGILKGVWKTGVRAGAGIYEVVTFPFPGNNDYQPVIADPEFIGQPEKE